MRLTTEARTIELAAGEFARFGELAVGGGGAGGRWRAEVGRDWHTALHAKVAAEAATTGTAGEWAFEAPVTTCIVRDRWTLIVEGRIDQLRRSSATAFLVREIKTVAEQLPRPAEHWRETRPEFFTQLALYCAGIAQRENANAVASAAGGAAAPVTVAGVLVLVEPATGVVQEVPLAEPPEFWLDAPARQIARFAEARRASGVRLSRIPLGRPFGDTPPRPEWVDARARLALAAPPPVLAEAPTGFGKTALALVDALERLRGGEISRVIYATGKNSGRLQVLRELDRIAGAGALNALTLHARREHAVAGIPDDPAAWRANWRRAAIEPDALFERGETSLEAVRALGAAAGVPPWEITRALLPLADFILCDYNYVFSPYQRGVLAGTPGWDPAATLLVVDEAHNLPARAAEARTLEADAPAAADALDALRAAGAPREWLRHWAAWAEFLEALPAADTPAAGALYLARDLCAEILRLWQEQPPFWLELDDDTLSTMETPAHMCAVWRGTDDDASAGGFRATGDDAFATGGSSGGDTGAGTALPFLTWSPRAGVLRAECLDAAPETGATLRAFHRAVLMSATLAPFDDFATECGLDAGPWSALECDAPWRRDAYTVRVDTRVDTRFTTRSRHFADTAAAVLEFAAAGDGSPPAVFFPSYRYAEEVRARLALLDPGFRVATQPAGATPAQNAAFLDEALLTAHALFLVMGGGLAEGVDLLGGRVNAAFIVSPALPEVTPARAARMDALARAGERDPFRRVYLLPALRKVNQALGRLVRAPGQRARVVLHCRRFAEPRIQSLLAPEYRTGSGA
ncbi:MAG: hypothetical protein LBR07_04135 [Puniceicoccales bacterium]|jgi:Rad3-related DNA helicase|nr:hypothetical protein [Puniceicoccales bacterium]